MVLLSLTLTIITGSIAHFCYFGNLFPDFQDISLP